MRTCHRSAINGVVCGAVRLDCLDPKGKDTHTKVCDRGIGSKSESHGARTCTAVGQISSSRHDHVIGGARYLINQKAPSCERISSRALGGEAEEIETELHVRNCRKLILARAAALRSKVLYATSLALLR